MTLYADLEALRASAADVRVVTSDGQAIAAHSYVLATASPLLEAMIDRARRGWGAADCTIRILGVTSDAVLAFLHFLYAARYAAIITVNDFRLIRGVRSSFCLVLSDRQLLALAHAYRVGWLKRAAESAVSARLTADRAVDMLKLARLCDAPRLYLRCARLARKDFPAVERSDGYRFARRHDPALELELLRLLEDADQRAARWERARASQEAYRQLGEAMDALDRIFADEQLCCGAPTSAGGDDKDKQPCAARDGTCRGLRLLMRHFATCARKIAPGGCARCKRMLQLFRLHASVCDRPEQEPCPVPLCSHFKAKKMQAEKADKTWQLLVKKVTRARAMASLARRKAVPEVVAASWARYNSSISTRWAKMR